MRIRMTRRRIKMIRMKIVKTIRMIIIRKKLTL